MKYTLYLITGNKTRKAGTGSVTVDKKGGHFFGQDNHVIAVMDRPQLEHIAKDGIILSGFESAGFDKTGAEKFRFVRWFLSYDKNE